MICAHFAHLTLECILGAATPPPFACICICICVFISLCICECICIRICIVFVAHLPLECIPSVPPLPHLHVSLNLRSWMDSDLQIRAVGWIQMDSDLNRRITGIPVN